MAKRHNDKGATKGVKPKDKKHKPKTQPPAGYLVHCDTSGDLWFGFPVPMKNRDGDFLLADARLVVVPPGSETYYRDFSKTKARFAVHGPDEIAYVSPNPVPKVWIRTAYSIMECTPEASERFANYVNPVELETPPPNEPETNGAPPEPVSLEPDRDPITGP